VSDAPRGAAPCQTVPVSAWSVTGRTVLVTGGNSGIGAATAAALAAHGAHVVIAVRDRARGEAAAAGIGTRGGHPVAVLDLDLASFASIHAAAERFRSRHDDLAVLVCNAGVFLGSRRRTADGFEATFGINHLGHFLLGCLLFDHLAASAPARVVVVASAAHRHAVGGRRLTDPRAARTGRGYRAYARSKLANVLFARELHRRYHGRGITAYSLHPGVVATRIAQDGDSRLAGLFWRLGARWMRSPTEGARTAVYLATEPGIEPLGGGYFADAVPVRPGRTGRDDDTAARLWATSEELVGCRYPSPADLDTGHEVC